MGYLLNFLKNRKIIILQIVNLILLAFSNSTSLVIPLLAGTALDRFNSEGIGAITQILYIFAALTFAALFSDFFQGYLDRYLAELIGYKIRNQLIRKLNSQSFTYINDKDNSKLLTVISGDVDLVKDFLSIWVTNIAGGVLAFVGSAILAYRTNPRMATYILLSLPLLGLLFGSLFIFLRKIFEKFRKLVDKLNHKINENIKAAMLVRVLNAQKSEQNKFNKTNKDLYKISIKIGNIYTLIIPIATSVSTAITLVIVKFGGEQVISGRMTIGDLTQFLAYITILTSPILMIGMLFTAIGNALAAGKRMEEVFKARVNIIEGSKSIPKFKSLKFEKVFLELKNEKGSEQILKNINFEIKKGETLGVIGPTGSGKSLLISLMLRLRYPSKGEIYLNNNKIKNYKLSDWRKLAALVPQDSLLIGGNIKENLTLGSSVSEEKLIKACQTAEIYEFIKELEDGFDTRIGEFGVNLSGGQKQRFAIARALVRDPQVLILDDASSKLDVKTELSVLGNLKASHPNITLIMVSQKIMSIQSADQIIVIENGNIEGKGTHNYLENNSFTYRQLMLSQL